jgi:hypothetical protein
VVWCALAAVALSLIGCQRPRALSRPPPPPLPLQLTTTNWEDGNWFGNQTNDLREVNITNAFNLRVLINSASYAHKPYLFRNRNLNLGGADVTNLVVTLSAIGSGRSTHPRAPLHLHFRDSLNIYPNATLRVANASLHVGQTGGIGGRLDLGPGAVMTASNLRVGVQGFSGGVISVSGGTLIVTNAAHNGGIIIGDTNTFMADTRRREIRQLDTGRIRKTDIGTFILEGGFVQADYLKVVGDRSTSLLVKGGTLKVNFISVTNGPVTIAEGATLELGDGTNLFTSLLTICSNATLRGNGTICGPVANYGTILAGAVGDLLTFTDNGSSFPSAVTNWGCMYMTNGGQLQFGGTVVNYAPPIVMPPKKTASGLVLRFLSVGGLTNWLESAPDLQNPLWTPVTNQVGTGEVLSFSPDAATGPRRFYRVRVTGS